MLERELQFDQSMAVSYEDPDGIVAISASVALIKPDGTTQQAPAVTLPALSTTCVAGSTASILILASVSGLLRGDKLRVTVAGYDYVVQAALIDATAKTVTLVWALPAAPTAGAVVKSLRISATLAAVGVAGIGGNYRLAWTYSDGTSTRTASEPAAVVRWRWVSPIGAADVREVVLELGGGNRSEQWCADVAARVDDKIRGKLSQTGRRPSLYLSASVFLDVARQGIRYELAQKGICLGGQVYEAQRELRFAFDDQLAQVIGGLPAYDTNADGAITGSETRPKHFSVQATR